MDTITVLTIILSVASITLSVTASIFGWVTYRNSTKMQMEAQNILSQVSQKVEVVVERTSHQMDRAWEFFTGNPLAKKDEDATNKEEQLKSAVIEEAKKEATDVMKKAGVDKDVLNSLVKKVETLVARSTVKTRELFESQQLVSKLSELEREMREYGMERIGFPPDIPSDLLIKEMSRFLPSSLSREVMRLFDMRSAISHGMDVSSMDVARATAMADKVLSFLQAERIGGRKRK